MTVEQQIKGNKIVLLILPAEKFNNSALNLAKKLSKNKRICYVSINKGYGALKESFKKNHINLKNFFFIDCITETILNPKKEELCKYISSPHALTELSLALSNEILDNYDLIIIDSLSTLAIYHSASAISQFISLLSQRIKNRNKTSEILLISSSDRTKEVFLEGEVLVDKVISLE